MVSTDEISLSQHIEFVNNLIDDTSKFYLAVFSHKQLLATLNYTCQSEGVWERGIISAPFIRGKHITSEVEKLVYPYLTKRGVTTLTAKVKRSNSRSLRYHHRMGYKLTGSDSEYEFFQLKL